MYEFTLRIPSGLTIPIDGLPHSFSPLTFAQNQNRIAPLKVASIIVWFSLSPGANHGRHPRTGEFRTGPSSGRSGSKSQGLFGLVYSLRAALLIVLCATAIQVSNERFHAGWAIFAAGYVMLLILGDFRTVG
jgi:hypothetical protein